MSSPNLFQYAILNARCAAIPQLSEGGYRFRKPSRFGSGTYVTIGILESEQTGCSIPCQADGTVELKALFQITDQLCDLVDQLKAVAI